MSATATPSIDIHLTGDDLRAALENDVRTGLTAVAKWLPPVWFYDDRGSQLFDEITRLDEYYPTRAERGLLEAHAPEIAARSGADTLVELGAGTCDKSRVLLDALLGAGTLRRYVPLDVSDGTLWAAALALVDEYPGLAVHAVVGDFDHHVVRIPVEGRRMVAFLGSTIGNFDPGHRRRFLFDLDCTMAHGDSFLLGTDLIKDEKKLVAAYDDAAGVTAEFNRNVLYVLNRELHAGFEPERFRHVALWNEEDNRIEMRLRSLDDQVVPIADLGLEVAFAAGEDLLTEISTKFTRSGVESELFEAGFVVDAMWEAPDGEFLLTLATPYC
ncbi:MAG TPA: L-histidine N(alpha)-methyltransferase [Acidimicrobiales bacterium]|nr:L-histidine N(alpha)-methyltransferase [Acidimicrobiales bacterium]